MSARTPKAHRRSNGPGRPGACLPLRLIAALGLLQSAGCALLTGADDIRIDQAAVPLLKHEAAFPGIWPGFWEPGKSFIVFDPDGDALLHTRNTPPAPWVVWPAGDDSGQELSKRGTIYLHRGRPEGLSEIFRINYPLGDETLTAVPLEEDVLNTQKTLFHESFHGYQHDHFAEYDEALNSMFVPPEAISARIVALAELEQKALADALSAEATPQIIDHCITYLALREIRLAELPSDAQYLERVYARNEGMATLAEARGVALIYAGDVDKASGYLRGNYLTERFNRFSSNPVDSMLRWRQYGIGAAIGQILGRLEVESWQQRVEEGEALDAMLAEAVRFDPQSAESVVSAVTSSPEFDARVEKMDRWLSSLDVPSANEVRKARRRIVVQFSDVCDVRGGGFKGDPIRVERDAILIRASWYHSDTDCMSLIAERTMVLQESGENGFIRMQIPVRRWPRIDGPEMNSGPVETDSLEIDAKRLKLHLRMTARVTRSPDELLIEFPQPPDPDS